MLTLTQEHPFCCFSVNFLIHSSFSTTASEFILLMKKTRTGGGKFGKGKGGPNGRGREGAEERPKKSFDKVTRNKLGVRGGVDGERKLGGKNVKATKKPEGAADSEKKFKPGFAPGEEGRLARRAQIIERKRMYRRNRKG